MKGYDVLKKLVSLLLCVVFLTLLCSCKPTENQDDTASATPSVSTPVKENPYAQNPLTGVYNLDKNKTNFPIIYINFTRSNIFCVSKE